MNEEIIRYITSKRQPDPEEEKRLAAQEAQAAELRDQASRATLASGLQSASDKFGMIAGKGVQSDTSAFDNAAKQNMVQADSIIKGVGNARADASKNRTDMIAEYLKEKRAGDDRADRKTEWDQKRAFDLAENKKDRESRLEAARIGNENKEELRTTLLDTPYGLANTPEDAKQLKEAYESKSAFDNKIKELITLREKHGGGALFNREDVARGKQLSKDLLLEYKNMAKLGVLSAADEKIINAIIPADPLAFDFIPGQDPILHKLKSFAKDSDSIFNTKLSTRLKGGSKLDPKATAGPVAESGTAYATGAPQPGSIVIHQGKKYRVGADGDSLEEVQ